MADITIDQFMAALGGQESGSQSDIENRSGSGAYGTYQIMPDNWSPWAVEAGLPANAPKTPQNQHIVAKHKIQQYYNQYGNWEDVAAVWYSGQPLGANADEPQYYNGDAYPSIREYTNSVVGKARQSAGIPSGARTATGSEVEFTGQPSTGDPNMAFPPNPPNPADYFNNHPDTTPGGSSGGGIDANGNGIPDAYEFDDETIPSNPDNAARLVFDQEMFRYQQEQDAWSKQFTEADALWKRTMDERDYYLAIGEYELAKQKQNDANHWQQQAMQFEQQMNNTKNLLTQMQMNQEYQTAYQAATSDAERNQINLAAQRDQAQMAKMNDDTQRAISGKDLNISAYGAETQRQLGLGQLASEQNKLIHDYYTNPRDHFGLFFESRGVTPDWDALAQGNAPQGDPMRIRDPLNVFDPTVQMPTDFNIGPGQSYGQVGQASQGVNLTGNQMTAPSAQPQISFASSPFPQPSQVGPSAPGAPGQQPLPTTGTVHYNTNPTVTVTPPPGQEGKGQMIANDNQVLASSGGIPQMKRFAEGGFTFDPMLMTGDSTSKNPFGGGAKPETIFNPTGAPIAVANSQQTRGMMQGGRNPFQNFDFGNMQARMQPFGNQQANMQPFMGGGMQQRFQGMRQAVQNMPQMNYSQMLGVAMPQQQQQFQNFGPQADPRAQGLQNQANNLQAQYRGLINSGGGYAPPQNNGTSSQMLSSYGGGYQNAPQQNVGQQGNQMWQGAMQRYNEGTMPRYPYGTLQNQTGPMTIQNSGNDWVQGDSPQKMQMLMDYGMPIAPGTYGAVTGAPARPLNVQSSFESRGGGGLPSLQTLRGMSGSERANFQGYAEGPVGIAYSDIIDYLTMATKGLGSAQSSGGINYGR